MTTRPKLIQESLQRANVDSKFIYQNYLTIKLQDWELDSPVEVTVQNRLSLDVYEDLFTISVHRANKDSIVVGRDLFDQSNVGGDILDEFVDFS